MLAAVERFPRSRTVSLKSLIDIMYHRSNRIIPTLLLLIVFLSVKVMILTIHFITNLYNHSQVEGVKIGLY